jgi:hypothetical protein
MENDMTKFTVRLSRECEVALAEAERYGINKSEFIRKATINYHASGGWKPSASPDRIEDSVMVEKEVKASDRMSDNVSDSDESAAEVFKVESFDGETREPGTQMQAPCLGYPYANPHTVPGKGTGKTELVFILILVAIIAFAFYVVLRKES